MNIEKLITETFTAHEHLAPDDDTVLAATRQRVHRRSAVLTRPLAVAAGVVVLTLAAVTVVALNRPGAENTTQGAAQSTDTAGQTSPPSESGVPDLTMPFTLDWLPDGEVEYVGHRVHTARESESGAPEQHRGEYLLTVTANGQALTVDVQYLSSMTVDEAAFKSGPGSPVTINGQPGTESVNSGGPGGYELYVTHPDGGVMYVNVGPSQDSTPDPGQLVSDGRRIAENIRFPGTTTVTPAFGLGELPTGMRLCGFEVGRPLTESSAQLSTNYTLGVCTIAPEVYVSNATEASPDEGVPGEPVQGRATRLFTDDGYHRLWIIAAVDDTPITVGGKVPPAVLYDVANRLVLPD